MTDGVLNSRRTAIVAGGTAGVGMAVVEALIARGYDVGVFARGQDRLSEVENRFGDRVMALQADVSDADAVMDAAKTVRKVWGSIDVWVNCAMLTAFSSFTDLTPDEFRAITDTTYHGQVWATRAALEVMEAGNIVNVGSGLSYRSVPYQSAYCGAKHAINGFTASVRSELIRDNRPIELSLVQLPAINTPQFDWARNRMDEMPQPAPPVYQPDIAAKAVMQAIDTNARELFVGKSVLQLFAGQMALPDFMDKQMASSGVPAQKSGTPQVAPRDGNLTKPEVYPASARGSFNDEARDRGLIVDADAARLGLFALIMGAGVVATSAFAMTRKR